MRLGNVAVVMEVTRSVIAVVVMLVVAAVVKIVVVAVETFGVIAIVDESSKMKSPDPSS